MSFSSMRLFFPGLNVPLQQFSCFEEACLHQQILKGGIIEFDSMAASALAIQTHRSRFNMGLKGSKVDSTTAHYLLQAHANSLSGMRFSPSSSSKHNIEVTEW